MIEISVLCVMQKSNYYLIPGLDLWDIDRDAYNFTGTNPVIVHPPCAQWSKMKWYAKDDPRQKELAFFCLEKVKQNGGILEHPAGSSFFKTAGIKPTISVNQSWFGFRGRKTTWLYFHGYKPIAHPITFDPPAVKNVKKMGKDERSKMPIDFCLWLVNCIR